MIDETVLERLLHDEAAAYDVPGDGPQRVLEAAAGDEDRGSRRGWWLGAVAAAVLVAVAVPLARDGGGLPSLGSRTESANDELALRDAPGATYATSADKGGEGAGGGGNELSEYAGPAVDSAHVVRTGETWLEVPERRVRDVLRDVARVAGTHGGYVSESDAETAGDTPRGQLTIRVPAAAYDRAVEDVAALGDVRQSMTRAEDVSDQVNDVAARLRSATATRAQLRTLLSRATTVGDVLNVQTRLDEVQTEIEKLQAQQQSLKDRTSFGTLRVYISPPGTADEAGGFRKAWDDAVDGFVGGFQALVAASGTVAFLLIVAAALFFVARRAYRVWVRGVV